MATGDILSVTIQPEGWQAKVVFEGITTYAAFNNGMGGPYANDPDSSAVPPGVPKLTLNVTSLGFDNTGNPTTVARKVYGTIPVRNVWDAARDDQFDKLHLCAFHWAAHNALPVSLDIVRSNP